MKSAKHIVIQTALRPMTIYVQYVDGTNNLYVVSDAPELFQELKNIEISKETFFHVNIGPGSYTGIRTGISYAMGLVHAGGLSNDNVKAYTSFDLIHAETESNLEQPIYIKSWPRMKNGRLSETKGYFFDGENIEHVQFEEIEATLDLIIFTEELEILDKEAILSNSTHVTSEILSKSATYDSYIEKDLPIRDLEPLYINPVNIGKAK